jgi:thiol-disulfide isomerase/thioredoxin
MRKQCILLLFISCISIFILSVNAQYDRLSLRNIGDPAPPLRVRQWIKGVPVENFQKGKVYVVEFWATWCKPCIAAMPHLSELNRKYKNEMTVIAIDIYESKARPVKSDKRVKDFVDSMGSRMDFNVAIEDSNFTVLDWIESTDEKNDGIPLTFVVNAEGRLAWIGHPSKLDEVLDKIINNTWSISEELAKRNENKRLAVLDDSLNYELMVYNANFYKPGDLGKPDSMLLMIREIVKNEPRLKYAPLMSYNTFAALLKTDPDSAYAYGKKVIVTTTFDQPAYYSITNAIEVYSEKLRLPAKIYELGAEAYKEEINQIPYPELVNMPKLYNNMAEMYWHAKNKAKAIEIMQKAIEVLKSKRGVSKKEVASFEQKLQKYNSM